MSNLDTKQLLSVIETQEESLVFTKFSYETACELGAVAAHLAHKNNLAVCISVHFGEFCVYKYSFPGTGLYNDLWMRRKLNTARVLQMPSLKAFVNLDLSGEDLKDNWFLEPMDYAAFGGAFPIRVKDTGIVGMLCISGLPHLDDHQLAADSLANYLKVSIPSVLG